MAHFPISSLADLRRTLRLADARHAHAAGCKKAPDECKQCQANIAWFDSLPLWLLSLCLREPQERGV